MEMRELLVDKKLFRESFGYCKHYVTEKVIHKDINLREIVSTKVNRLCLRGNKVFLKPEKKQLFIPDDKYDAGIWLVLVPMCSKNVDGLPEHEINPLVNMLEATQIGTFKKLKRLLKTQGIALEFNKGE